MDLPIQQPMPLTGGAPTASDPFSMYQRMLEMRRSLPPSPIETQRAEALKSYQDSVLNDELPTQTPQDAFMQGMMIPPQNMGDPFSRMRLAIDASDRQREAIRQEMMQRKQLAAQLAYKDVVGRDQLDSAEEKSLMSRGAIGSNAGKWVQSKDDAGNLYWVNNVTRETSVSYTHLTLPTNREV